MDYIDLPASFLYETKKDINDFHIDVDKSLEREFFKLLKRRPFIRESEDAPQNVLAIYNNACYICILIALEKNPTLYFNKYMKIASDNHKNILWENHMLPATMALVYNWIRTDLFKSTHSSFSDIDEEERNEFVENVFENFQDWNEKGAQTGKEDFYGLIVDTNLYKTSMGHLDFDMRNINEVITSLETYPMDIVKGIDYILELISDGLYDKKEESIYHLQRMQKFYEKNIYAGHDLDSNHALMKIKELIIKLEAKPLKEEKFNLSLGDISIEQIPEIGLEDIRIKELETEVRSLCDENEQLKEAEQAPNMIINNLKNEIKRLKEDKENLLVELLKPAFFDFENDTRDFLRMIDGLDNQGVTDIARQFLKNRKIAPSKTGRPIWLYLHAAKLYSATEQNWTAAMRKDL